MQYISVPMVCHWIATRVLHVMNWTSPWICLRVNKTYTWIPQLFLRDNHRIVAESEYRSHEGRKKPHHMLSRSLLGCLCSQPACPSCSHGAFLFDQRCEHSKLDEVSIENSKNMPSESTRFIGIQHWCPEVLAKLALSAELKCFRGDWGEQPNWSIHVPTISSCELLAQKMSYVSAIIYRLRVKSLNSLL